MHNLCRPISGFIPPYLLRQIAQNGTPLQQEQAMRTLAITEQLREERWAAESGSEAPPITEAVNVKQRMVYDAQYGSSLPGQLVRQESEPPTGDPAADEAYDGCGVTYDLFWEIYKRNSIDDKGLVMDATVHYLRGYDNAFWNGSQMVFGDGDEDLPPDQRLFNRFTIAPDITAHELSHGVIQYSANLNYSSQSGALNESFSDVFGALAKQRRLSQTAAQADWIIGEGLFTSNVNGVGIRSMKAPGTAYDDPVLGKDPQPAHMRDYVNTIEDNGGVHINSGIPNHAFYRAALEIGENAWEKAGMIWYISLRDKLDENSNFQDAARLTIEAAGELFGSESLEQQAVRRAWADVGVTTTNGGNSSTGCLPALLSLLRPRSQPGR